MTENLSLHTDLNEAIQYLKESIKQGDTFGMTTYASIIEKKDRKKAEEYYKKAVEKEPKNYPLKKHIDFLKRNNRNEKMKKYIKIGCENNDANSIYIQAFLLYQDNKINDCITYLKRGIKLNNTEPMVLYALLISEVSQSEALKYYKMAVEKGSVKAMFCLALDISDGKIVIENGPSDAVKYMEMAANKYYKGASAFCFDWFLRGVNCEKNIEKAMKYLKRAAIDDNDAACQYWYGYFNLLGKNGLKVNNDLGIKFLKMATDQKYPKAFYVLGSLCLEGSIVKKDVKKAADLFRMGADLDDPESINVFVSCLLTGNGL